MTLDELLSAANRFREAAGAGDARQRRFAVNFVARWYIPWVVRQGGTLPDAQPERHPRERHAAANRPICTRAEARANFGEGRRSRR